MGAMNIHNQFHGTMSNSLVNNLLCNKLVDNRLGIRIERPSLPSLCTAPGEVKTAANTLGHEILNVRILIMFAFSQIVKW